jgi:hypothetical protein
MQILSFFCHQFGKLYTHSIIFVPGIQPDPGRIYIKGYISKDICISKDIYPILISQKGHFLSLFGEGYFGDIIPLF